MKQTFHCSRCTRCASCSAAHDLYERRRRAYQVAHRTAARKARARGVGPDRALELGRKAGRKAAKEIR